MTTHRESNASYTKRSGTDGPDDPRELHRESHLDVALTSQSECNITMLPVLKERNNTTDGASSSVAIPQLSSVDKNRNFHVPVAKSVEINHRHLKDRGAKHSKGKPSIMSSLKSRKLASRSEPDSQQGADRLESSSAVSDQPVRIPTLHHTELSEESSSLGREASKQRKISKSPNDRPKPLSSKEQYSKSSHSGGKLPLKSLRDSFPTDIEAATTSHNIWPPMEEMSAERAKKRRGRPPKHASSTATVSRSLDHEHLLPNVSPDSGIQSIAGSPRTHEGDVPSPNHHHPAVHPFHPTFPFPPEAVMPNPANYTTAFHRLYPHLNPAGLASFYPPHLPSPFHHFMHPTVNFQQAFLNFTNSHRLAAVAAATTVDHSPSKQSDHLNKGFESHLSPKSLSITKPANSEEGSSNKPEVPSKRPKPLDVNPEATLEAQSQSPNAHESSPLKKRIGRPRKTPDSNRKTLQEQPHDVHDRTTSEVTLPQTAEINDKNKPPKPPKPPVPVSKSAGERTRRGRPPKDAIKAKPQSSPDLSDSPNALSYLSTAPVATCVVPGSHKILSDDEILQPPVVSAESIIPKHSAIAMAVSSHEGEPNHQGKSSGKSPSQSDPNLPLGSPSPLTKDPSFSGSNLGLPPKKKRGRPRKNPPNPVVEHKLRSDGDATPADSEQLINPPASTETLPTSSSVPIIPKTTKKSPIVAPSSFGQPPNRPMSSTLGRKRFKTGNVSNDNETPGLVQNVNDPINKQFINEDQTNSSENYNRGTDLRGNIEQRKQGFAIRKPGRPSLLQKHDASEINDSHCGPRDRKASNKTLESRKSRRTKLPVMMRKTSRRGRKPKYPPIPVHEQQSHDVQKKKKQSKPPFLIKRSPEMSLKPPTLRNWALSKTSSIAELSDSGMATDSSDVEKSSGPSMPVLSPVNAEFPLPSDSPSEDFKFKKRKKKRYKQTKSKHKNIVDPVFLADLEGITQDLSMMGISENPEHYLMRLQPGEIPMPSMFKIHRAIVKRRRKNKELPLNKFRRLESKKDYADFAAVVRERSKRGRKKKFLCEEYVSEKEDDDIIPIHIEQCLPPKKRHKLLAAVETEPYNNDEAAPLGSAQEPIIVESNEPSGGNNQSDRPDVEHIEMSHRQSIDKTTLSASQTGTKASEKRKAGRPRKHPLPEDTNINEMQSPLPTSVVPLTGKNILFY